jgi:hypothetical protein
MASAVFAVGEVGYAMSVPALTARWSPQERIARAFAAQNTATSLAFLAGPALTTALLGVLSPPLLMATAAVLVASCVVPVMRLAARAASATQPGEPFRRRVGTRP